MKEYGETKFYFRLRVGLSIVISTIIMVLVIAAVARSAERPTVNVPPLF